QQPGRPPRPVRAAGPVGVADPEPLGAWVTPLAAPGLSLRLVTSPSTAAASLVEGASAWDAGVLALGSPPPLLQWWGFGEGQAQEGWSPERVVLPGGGRAQVLLRGAGPLRWAYVPRGPAPAARRVVEELIDWARERSLARLRVEPEAPPAFGET